MSEPTLTFEQQISIAYMTGLFTLGGAFVVLIGSFFREFLKGKQAIELERLKIHDAEKKNAYRELLIFTKDIMNNSFPLYEGKQAFFSMYMKKNFQKIVSNYPFYTKPVIDILDEMEDNYTCLTSPDLMDFADEVEEDYIQKKLNARATDLYKAIKREIKEWT